MKSSDSGARNLLNLVSRENESGRPEEAIEYDEYDFRKAKQETENDRM